MSNKYLLKKIEYVHKQEERNNSIFIAIKLALLFFQKVIAGQSIQDSNERLCEVLQCSLSGLHYAFRILEANGILTRTYADDNKFTRTQFIFNLEKFVSWLKLTKYDDEYINAPKRSFKRAVVNQTSIIIKDVRSKVERAIAEIKRIEKITDRKVLEDKIKVITAKVERDYTRYLKHLKTRATKLAKTEARRQEKAYKDSLIKTIIEMSMSYGHKPPDSLKTA
ncbi:Uncharacterised protein [Acholeplasma oculi]|uniref:Phage protein L2_12 of Acholeplasma phage L2 n=1 Tax=Acholeplasma oculi TaxID=35623 RepID=A0A061A9S9_9MOLU|nr:hypothetical protein [Acholeplasma oculi]CDR30660.1 Phage protein L2_12 of Acholeplasma phage L2 [Acholeplasma oculi]SKC34613.1 hypothetical protein SAMN02745122_0013 [Acholeplasma oculi]SUT89425.1 Uncharacterised protein [Acholeplasma oculi]